MRQWLHSRTEPPAFAYVVLLRHGVATGAESADATSWPSIGIVGCLKAAPEVGYCAHPDHWGHGYMSEALTAFVSIFWEDGPEMIETGAGSATAIREPEDCTSKGEKKRQWGYLTASVHHENGASRRVAEKSGFFDMGTTHEIQSGPCKGQMSVEYRIDRPSPGV